MYLDNILIYTENDRDNHVVDVQWVLKQLNKFLLYTNLKKCRFHQDKIWFPDYVVSLQSIRIEEETIEAVK